MAKKTKTSEKLDVVPPNATPPVPGNYTPPPSPITFEQKQACSEALVKIVTEKTYQGQAPTIDERIRAAQQLINNYF